MRGRQKNHTENWQREQKPNTKQIQNQHTRELISAWNMEHKYNKNDLSCLQWLSPGTCVNTRYINSTRGTSSIQNQTKPRSRKINSPGLLLVLSSTVTLGLSSCCMPLISGGSMGFRRYTLHTAQQQDRLFRMLHTMTRGLSSPSKHAGSDSHHYYYY